jgi:hypothetical protein
MVTVLVTKMATYSATATESCRRGGGSQYTPPYLMARDSFKECTPEIKGGLCRQAGNPPDLMSLALTYLRCLP